MIKTFTLILFVFPFFVKAQDTSNGQDKFIPLPPKFLSLRTSKFSIGAGLEGAFPAMMKSAGNPPQLDIQYKGSKIADQNKYPYASGGITLDIYSDNSLTGLLGGVNYSVSTTTYRQDKIASDYFSINRVEIPVYLKLRPGAIASKSHLWLLLGGIFSMPVSLRRQYIVDSSISPDGTITYTDTNVSQVNDLFLVSTSAGYEGYITKVLRAAVFFSVSYSLNGQFNRDYVRQSAPTVIIPTENGPPIVGYGNSVLASFPNYVSHEFRLTLGTKFFIKLSKNGIRE